MTEITGFEFEQKFAIMMSKKFSGNNGLLLRDVITLNAEY